MSARSTDSSGDLPAQPRPMTKGQRTAARIMDVAEQLFAVRGFEATSLRQIAHEAQLTEPALYNHFRDKQALYAAVLDRALEPMASVLESQLGEPGDGGGTAGHPLKELPARMTDLLVDHPHMAALFQQALQGEADSLGNQLMKQWLDRLLLLGSQNMQAQGLQGRPNRETMAIQIIALFNLVTGYFLAQRAFTTLTGDEQSILTSTNIDRQKKLLRKMIAVLA